MTEPEPQIRDAAAIRVVPPLVPLATVLSGIALQKFMPVGLDGLLPTPLRYWVGGGIILFALYFFGFRAVRLMRQSGQSENPFKKTTAILESGPYRITRNPMYVFMVLSCLGFAIALSNLWILLLTPVCAILLHVLVILPEEEYLERKFGDTYLAYKTRVRRWI
ncbi:MAG: isoprenylcysteine carboxylmethyltransferase family protein [Acidimicrobiales bacterium]|nr:isoprenylcysteine carboxylmethyltransferase family protein [Hyphomonadaceae bacterium]RZV34321.1 MAG: isoprenylcysteine carboxylmethyltransferase family protein [Acidimicrobiales bacterium]